MSHQHKTCFEDICKPGAKSGYVLDYAVPLTDETISDAVGIVCKKNEDIMKKIVNGRETSIDQFYIGKTYIRKKKGRKFDPNKPDTWLMDDGIDKRYISHLTDDQGRDGHGKGGLVVLAVITEESIPEDCVTKGYIIHPEEYALTLEKRLIQKYMKEHTGLANKTTNPGKTDKRGSNGYVVYMAFRLESK